MSPIIIEDAQGNSPSSISPIHKRDRMTNEQIELLEGYISDYYNEKTKAFIPPNNMNILDFWEEFKNSMNGLAIRAEAKISVEKWQQKVRNYLSRTRPQRKRNQFDWKVNEKISKQRKRSIEDSVMSGKLKKMKSEQSESLDCIPGDCVEDKVAEVNYLNKAEWMKLTERSNDSPSKEPRQSMHRVLDPIDNVIDVTQTLHKIDGHLDCVHKSNWPLRRHVAQVEDSAPERCVESMETIKMNSQRGSVQTMDRQLSQVENAIESTAQVYSQQGSMQLEKARIRRSNPLIESIKSVVAKQLNAVTLQRKTTLERGDARTHTLRPEQKNRARERIIAPRDRMLSLDQGVQLSQLRVKERKNSHTCLLKAISRNTSQPQAKP